MAMISQILAEKGSDVLFINPDATIFEASLMMNRNKVGALVVLKNKKLVGIISERDVLTKVIAAQLDPTKTLVSKVMTRDVIKVSVDKKIEDASQMMTQCKIRHLPVVDNQDQLRGMISIGDINCHRMTRQARRISSLEDYLYGYAM